MILGLAGFYQLLLARLLAIFGRQAPKWLQNNREKSCKEPPIGWFSYFITEGWLYF
jgi:hypothetical protein